MGSHDLLGYVIASVPFDRALLRKVKARSGLDSSEQFVVVQNGRLVAGAGWTQAPLRVPPERPATLELNGERVRVLIADTPGSSATEPTLGVLCRRTRSTPRRPGSSSASSSVCSPRSS